MGDEAVKAREKYIEELERLARRYLEMLVDVWHADEGLTIGLDEYLGMSKEQYDAWVRTRKLPTNP